MAIIDLSDSNKGLFATLLTKVQPWHIYTFVSVYVGYRVVYQLFLYPWYFSPLRHAPGPPRGHWLWGQMPAIIKSEAGVLQREWLKNYGDKRGIIRAVGPFGIERMMFLSNEAMHKILVSDWIDYPRPDFMRNILGLTAGYGLLTVTGNRHKQMRRFMNPAFSINSLTAQADMYYDPIYKLVDILHKTIAAEPNPEEGKVFLMYEWMSKITLDIICITAFGYEANSLQNPDNELATAYHNLIELQSGENLVSFIAILSIPGMVKLVQSEWLYKHRKRLEPYRNLAPLSVLMDSMRRIKAVGAALVQEKMVEAAAVSAGDTTTKKDIMSLLVRARSNEEQAKAVPFAKTETSSDYRMSDEEMMQQVLTFLGAGHETTASGLSWSLWLLAKHPEAQTRLRREMEQVLEKSPTPDYKTLKECEYLECVVMEALRIFPPVPMTIRKAAKSDWIDGIWVPKGTLFYIPIRPSNHWNEVWGDDSEEFKPERWMNLPPAYNSTFSFQSFIAGPHACIGRTMAVIEMKAILGVLIAHFSFELASPDQTAHPTSAITMKPADNLPLRVRSVRPMTSVI